MMGGSSSRIAAGLGAALFVAYCIYFDKKRRSDPNYKNKLRERRKKQKAVQEKAGLSKLPDLKDAEAVQKFFLEEIQLGEELLAQAYRQRSECQRRRPRVEDLQQLCDITSCLLRISPVIAPFHPVLKH
ncbi:hypothetical protein cypCar_00034502 [Cyprinus carpio]|nr:hypothetical protein cypCar_00034502 [Cyprinus carpio]